MFSFIFSWNFVTLLPAKGEREREPIADAGWSISRPTQQGKRLHKKLVNWKNHYRLTGTLISGLVRFVAELPWTHFEYPPTPAPHLTSPFRLGMDCNRLVVVTKANVLFHCKVVECHVHPHRVILLEKGELPSQREEVAALIMHRKPKRK